jgi:hypothetical protein
MPIKIGVIALSRFLEDPRVRRQCEMLQSHGFQVFAIGQDDVQQEAVSWTIAARAARLGRATCKSANASLGWGGCWFLHDSLRNLARRFLSQPLAAKFGIVSIARAVNRLVLVARAQRCRIQPNYAQRIFWSWRADLQDLYEKAKHLRCDIWLANDWTALPIAARLATENGGFYIYDTHEFALEEYHERWTWRLSQKPIVAALEKSFIYGAQLVTAVSSGISDRVTEIYDLPKPALTIRNTPPYVATSFRPTPPQVRVLYHGIVAPGRGLEAAIESVIAWTPDRELYIRGPGAPEYIAGLKRQIETAKLQSRVFIIPPVPMTELVVAAAEFDVGFFALPGHSLHNQFALPNKFFEYTMAGLALSVSRLPEMELLMNEFELGTTFLEVEPGSIAAAINAMSRDKIDCFKRNALKAARTLCWEKEGEKLLAAINELTVESK